MGTEDQNKQCCNCKYGICSKPIDIYICKNPKCPRWIQGVDGYYPTDCKYFEEDLNEFKG